MWTTQKHVPRWDLPARLAGAQLGVKTPLPIHEGASRHTFFGICQSKQIGLLKLTSLTLFFFRKQGHIYVVEFHCPFDTNMGKNHKEKIFKCQPLVVELNRLYHSWKVSICPLIFGALGAIWSDTINIIKSVPKC